jgi:hypothetical protein
MQKHLESARREDRRIQIDSDAVVGLSIMEREVTYADIFVRMNRQMLILYAYAGADSISPLLVQEVPLDSFLLPHGAVQFSSLISSIRELNRNLRLMPSLVDRFEVVLTTRRVLGGAIPLLRSRRFALNQSGVMLVPCVDEDAAMQLPGGGRGGTGVVLSVQTTTVGQQEQAFSKIDIVILIEHLQTLIERNATPVFLWATRMDPVPVQN